MRPGTPFPREDHARRAATDHRARSSWHPPSCRLACGFDGVCTWSRASSLLWSHSCEWNAGNRCESRKLECPRRASLPIGSTPKEIMAVEPDFVEMLGLGQSLTPSRTNGFMNMLRLMQKKTLECYMAAEAAKESN